MKAEHVLRLNTPLRALLESLPGGSDCWLSRIEVSRPPSRFFSSTAVSVRHQVQRGQASPFADAPERV